MLTEMMGHRLTDTPTVVLYGAETVVVLPSTREIPGAQPIAFWWHEWVQAVATIELGYRREMERREDLPWYHMICEMPHE